MKPYEFPTAPDPALLFGCGRFRNCRRFGLGHGFFREGSRVCHGFHVGKAGFLPAHHLAADSVDHVIIAVLAAFETDLVNGIAVFVLRAENAADIRVLLIDLCLLKRVFQRDADAGAKLRNQRGCCDLRCSV